MMPSRNTERLFRSCLLVPIQQARSSAMTRALSSPHRQAPPNLHAERGCRSTKYFRADPPRGPASAAPRAPSSSARGNQCRAADTLAAKTDIYKSGRRSPELGGQHPDASVRIPQGRPNKRCQRTSSACERAPFGVPRGTPCKDRDPDGTRRRKASRSAPVGGDRAVPDVTHPGCTCTTETPS
jgi:hypothetical protein